MWINTNSTISHIQIDVQFFHFISSDNKIIFIVNYSPPLNWINTLYNNLKVDKEFEFKFKELTYHVLSYYIITISNDCSNWKWKISMFFSCISFCRFVGNDCDSLHDNLSWSICVFLSYKRKSILFHNLSLPSITWYSEPVFSRSARCALKAGQAGIFTKCSVIILAMSIELSSLFVNYF